MLSDNSLGLAESDFGVKLGSMSVQEPHQGLATAIETGQDIQTLAITMLLRAL